MTPRYRGRYYNELDQQLTDAMRESRLAATAPVLDPRELIATLRTDKPAGVALLRPLNRGQLERVASAVAGVLTVETNTLVLDSQVLEYFTRKLAE